MAKIPNNRFSIDITNVEGSNLYVLEEPHNERFIPFLVEAAHFIRDTSGSKEARVQLRNGESFEFGKCGVTLQIALNRLMAHFVEGKRDFFLSIVEEVTIDNDNQLEIKINPAKLNRGAAIDQLSDKNVIAYQMQEIMLYFNTFAERNLLAEYVDLLGASPSVVRHARPMNVQKAIGSQPIRFVNMDGKRVNIVQRNHPRLGTGIPDIDIG